MTIDLDTSSIDTMLDAFAAGLGSGALIRFFSGDAPAECSDADTGYELCIDALPDDFWSPANGGAKVLSTTWTFTAAAEGTPGYFRIYGSDYACKMQGTVTEVGAGGDLQLVSTALEQGAPVTVVALTLTRANL